MKSSSISFIELYFGLATSSSSSTSTLRKESYERAAFSALRASASSRSAFFCQIERLRLSQRVRILWRKKAYLGGGGGTLNGVLAFDSFNPFCFMIDDALNLCLVEMIYDSVFALRDMDYTAYNVSSLFFPMLRIGAYCVSPKMCRAQLDELFGTNSAAYSLVIMKRHLSYSHISRFLQVPHASQSHN